MKRLLLLILILFVSISAVSASDNFTDDAVGIADDNIVAQTDSIGISADENYPISDVSVDEVLSSEGNVSSGDTGENEELNISIQAEDFVWYYKANPVYTFNIVDSNGTGVYARNVSVTLNNENLFVDTDENGTANLNIALNPGNYNILIEYANKSVTKNIKLLSSRVTHTGDITTKYGTNTKYVVRLLDNSGKPVVGYGVNFTIGKKSYTRYTNANGYATLFLKYNSGKYVINYFADGFTGKNNYVVNNYVSMEILKWGLTGDVSKAPLIKKNMPNNYWVKKAVEATKKGIPLITIKGGNGKVVFMTAGVHGNELNSQVAAMKMITYMTTNPIKGTVYIIPFVNVKAISKKVRLTNYDFNRVAHKAGTVSNKITKLITKYKCDAYGDFHTTVSPGVPGINVVLGYKSPTKCVDLSNYIAKNAKVNKIFYYPGQKYRWSLADWVNYKGTPAVICEVISPVNKVSTKATDLSYKEMSAFLNYNKIL
ncbi:MAG: succinylglutamate desuccinylase/aspartoacylase family protein [Methanobrevibacter sp.]|uniref:succinylglutamate desuccinylase/aspartoacylase family protein n=1 Tax=Methanobrevibacter sp. TaxID=66852 RepID=UPI0025F8B689|nr:succinylglutamate desuccinylase/aspartoacylase family protein [Methanobrevibacter sp.]MBQ6098275.1 succinylglutamate desuccinylase/aspartoacylase family protein [Methanobrevibacter sp.]